MSFRKRTRSPESFMDCGGGGGGGGVQVQRPLSATKQKRQRTALAQLPGSTATLSADVPRYSQRHVDQLEARRVSELTGLRRTAEAAVAELRAALDAKTREHAEARGHADAGRAERERLLHENSVLKRLVQGFQAKDAAAAAKHQADMAQLMGSACQARDRVLGLERENTALRNQLRAHLQQGERERYGGAPDWPPGGGGGWVA